MLKDAETGIDAINPMAEEPSGALRVTAPVAALTSVIWSMCCPTGRFGPWDFTRFGRINRAGKTAPLCSCAFLQAIRSPKAAITQAT